MLVGLDVYYQSSQQQPSEWIQCLEWILVWFGDISVITPKENAIIATYTYINNKKSIIIKISIHIYYTFARYKIYIIYISTLNIQNKKK